MTNVYQNAGVFYSTGTIGNYYRPIGNTTSTSITMTAKYNENIWRQWTSQATTTGGNRYQLIDHDSWVWQPSVKYEFQLSWEGWNTSFVETAERARQHKVLQWQDIARRSARHPGRHHATLESLLATLVNEALTDDEQRLIEDAWQRGSEEHREDEHQAELARLAQHEREQLRAEANRRAELLLLTLLSHEQKEEWLAHRRVTEVAPSGRVWRLFPKWSGAACLMNGEVRRATLCLHPFDRVPEPDVMAAIIVHLRAGEEDEMIKIAVLHDGAWNQEEINLRRDARTLRVPAADGNGDVAIAAA